MFNKRLRRFSTDGKEYTLREFKERFQRDLPRVAQVIQGFCGNKELETFSSGQVLFIQAVFRQKRVAGRETLGVRHKRDRHLSIPLNYPVKFHVLQMTKDKKLAEVKSTAMSLMDISFNKDLKLPLEVQMVCPEQTSLGAGSDDHLHNFGNIVLESYYEEAYFIANTIDEGDGTINHDVISVPLYLADVRLSLVNGLRGGQREWDTFLQKLEDEITVCDQTTKRRLDLRKMDIALYAKEDVCSSQAPSFEYMEPDSYVRLIDVSRRDRESHVYSSLNEAVMQDGEGHAQWAFVTSKQPVQTVLKGFTKASVNEHPRPPPLPHRPGNDLPPVPRRDLSAVHVPKRNNDNANLQNINDVNTAVVRPTHHKTRDDKRHDMDTASKPAQAATIKYLDLSVEDVTDVLKRLGLDRHTAIFEEHLVDGEILRELNEAVLKEEFGFRSVEVIKLLKFIREGHIPKRKDEYSFV